MFYTLKWYTFSENDATQPLLNQEDAIIIYDTWTFVVQKKILVVKRGKQRLQMATSDYGYKEILCGTEA